MAAMNDPGKTDRGERAGFDPVTGEPSGSGSGAGDPNENKEDYDNDLGNGAPSPRPGSQGASRTRPRQVRSRGQRYPSPGDHREGTALQVPELARRRSTSL